MRKFLDGKKRLCLRHEMLEKALKGSDVRISAIVETDFFIKFEFLHRAIYKIRAISCCRPYLASVNGCFFDDRFRVEFVNGQFFAC